MAWSQMEIGQGEAVWAIVLHDGTQDRQRILGCCSNYDRATSLSEFFFVKSSLTH